MTESRFVKEPEKPTTQRTTCCKGMLYTKRCILCLKWYTYDFLKEQYDKERVYYSHLQDPDEWAILKYTYGADKPGPPSATQVMLGVSPIEALRKLQEKLKGAMKTGGPTDGEESSEPVGFDIFVEDDLFPEKQPAAELPCICKITAHGPIESKHCLWHQERKKRGEQ